MTPAEPSSTDHFPGSEPPPWVGYWRVRRYDGAEPSVPTYYDASLDSWDVIKKEDTQLHVARHPILEIQGHGSQEYTLILKDEGASDDAAETWRVGTDGDQVRVVATTGPHEGAVGIAERIPTDPREGTSQP